MEEETPSMEDLGIEESEETEEEPTEEPNPEPQEPQVKE